MLGLLHTCWQNSKRVRKDWTYKYGNGDRDSWWLGFELTGVPYSWEGRYGGTIGWREEREGKENWVCGNTTLHLDEHEKPLWFSGGLLKTPGDDGDQAGYEMPTHWTMDGLFRKADEEGGMNCMLGDTVNELRKGEKRVLGESIEAAKAVDEKSRLFNVKIYNQGQP